MNKTSVTNSQTLCTEDLLIQMIHQEAVLKQSIQQHIQEVDLALAARDKARFIELTDELKRLETFSKR